MDDVTRWYLDAEDETELLNALLPALAADLGEELGVDLAVPQPNADNDDA